MTSYKSELINPLTYTAYKALVEELVAEQGTTGEEQTEQKIGFAKLNLQRMKRVEKQFALLPALQQLFTENEVNWKWLVLVESWCGDGAQILPAIAAMADQVTGIELTILLRDQNPDLMDTCLTNGTRSIPKLICLDADSGERIFVWGPRPQAIQDKAMQFKKDNPAADHEAFVLNLHTLYAKDRSLSMQQDMLQLLQGIFNAKQEMATV